MPKRDTSDLQAQLRIDKINLDDEFSEQPSRFVYWLLLAENAKEAYDRSSLQLEILEAELDNSIRKRYAQTGERVTERNIENAIKLEDTWQAVSSDKLVKKKELGVLNAAVEAFKHRKDMLMSLGFSRREEQESVGMSVTKQRAENVMRRKRLGEE